MSAGLPVNRGVWVPAKPSMLRRRRSTDKSLGRVGDAPQSGGSARSEGNAPTREKEFHFSNSKSVLARIRLNLAEIGCKPYLVEAFAAASAISSMATSPGRRRIIQSEKQPSPAHAAAAIRKKTPTNSITPETPNT